MAGCALELTKGTTHTPFVILFEGRLARINYYRYLRLQRQGKKKCCVRETHKGCSLYRGRSRTEPDRHLLAVTAQRRDLVRKCVSVSVSFLERVFHLWPPQQCDSVPSIYRRKPVDVPAY